MAYYKSESLGAVLLGSGLTPSRLKFNANKSETLSQVEGMQELRLFLD